MGKNYVSSTLGYMFRLEDFLLKVKMVLCCRCNRTGQCRGCACVKAGNLCSNCLPSRLGSCSNVSPATNANTMTRHVPVHNEMSTTTPISSRTANPSTTSCSHTPAVAAASLAVSNSEVASTPETLIQQQPNSNSTTPQCSGPSQRLSVPPPLLPNLPTFKPVADHNFVWGETDTVTFCKSIREAYVEVIIWRNNCFQVPLGSIGKSFVAEMAKLYNSFASGSTLESIALTVTIILPVLLLQQPHKRSKPKEHTKRLERRLKIWRDRDLAALIREGRTIQQRLPKVRRANAANENRLTRTFANLMFKGKTHTALDLLANRCAPP